MKYFDSWIPAYLLCGSIGFITLTAFLYNPIGPIIGFIILGMTLLSGLFRKPKSSKQPLSN